ncbi:MAG: AraC family transcriptional regulator [Erythrobacter sp.]
MLVLPMITGFNYQTDVFVSHDLKTGCDYLSNLFVPHTLKKVSEHPLRMRVEHIDLGKCTIVRSSYGASINIEPDDMRSVYQVKIPISGKLQIHSREQNFELEEGVGCLIVPTKNLRYQMVGSDSQFLTISLDADYFASRIAVVLGASQINDQSFDPILPMENSNCQIWLRMLQHIWNQREWLAAAEPEVAEIFKQDFCDLIADRLLMLYQKSDVDQATEHPAPVPRIVRSAMAYVDANFHNRIALDDIANWSGTSGRNLQLKFRTHLNMTPQSYVLKKRLIEAHRRLVAGQQNNETVTGIALACGIPHLSRFAAHYRDMFGCSPHDTLRQNG